MFRKNDKVSTDEANYRLRQKLKRLGERLDCSEEEVFAIVRILIDGMESTLHLDRETIKRMSKKEFTEAVKLVLDLAISTHH